MLQHMISETRKTFTNTLKYFCIQVPYVIIKKVWFNRLEMRHPHVQWQCHDLIKSFRRPIFSPSFPQHPSSEQKFSWMLAEHWIFGCCQTLYWSRVGLVPPRLLFSIYHENSLYTCFWSQINTWHSFIILPLQAFAGFDVVEWGGWAGAGEGETVR